MALIPLVYALAPQLPFLILINILVGVFSAFYDAASLTYILEKTLMGEKGFYTAVYNLSLGLAFFTGSLVAGCALGLLQHLWPLDYALTFLYIIITVVDLYLGYFTDTSIKIYITILSQYSLVDRGKLVRGYVLLVIFDLAYGMRAGEKAVEIASSRI